MENLLGVIGASGGSLLGLTLAFRFLHGRINQKVDKSACEPIRSHFVHELERGNGHFKTLFQEMKDMREDQREHGEKLSQVLTDLDWIKKKNGG